MAITIFFPYIAILGNGQKIPMQGPTVDSLPITPDSRGENLILTATVGVWGPGAYQWVNNRWQFILDYSLITSEIFRISQAYVVFPNAGDNLLPIGPSGQANVTVFKNGTLQPASYYTVTSQGISLVTPARLNEIFVVNQESPITAITPITGSGVPDAPSDGSAYVRKNAAWGNIQNELNEGKFTGN